jgi:acetyl-CoA acetyltransferase
MTNLRDKYAIVGVGQSPIGEVPEMDSISLLAVAMKHAIEDAGLTKHDIDGIVCRGPDEVYTHHQPIGQTLGINANYSLSLTSGGASQCAAVSLAAMAIEAGLCETVVCGYGRNTWSRTRGRKGGRKGRAAPLVPNTVTSERRASTRSGADDTCICTERPGNSLAISLSPFASTHR